MRDKEAVLERKLADARREIRKLEMDLAKCWRRRSEDLKDFDKRLAELGAES